MNLNTGDPTTETAVTNEIPDGNDNYVPTFNAATRKWAYLVSGLIGIAGAVLSFVSAVPEVPSWVAVLGGDTTQRVTGLDSVRRNGRRRCAARQFQHLTRIN